MVLCQSGHGELHLGGKVHRFGADTTLALPRRRVHQFFNTGTEPMEIVGVFAATPVVTRLPDGSELALPWRT